jgi:hypothetical protein
VIRNAEGLVVDIYNGTTTAGATVWAWGENRSYAQLWGYPAPVVIVSQ